MGLIKTLLIYGVMFVVIFCVLLRALRSGAESFPQGTVLMALFITVGIYGIEKFYKNQFIKEETKLIVTRLGAIALVCAVVGLFTEASTAVLSFFVCIVIYFCIYRHFYEC